MHESTAQGRWPALFADMEARLEGLLDAELDMEVAERTRAETARLELADLLRGACGSPLVLRLGAAVEIRVHVQAVGPDWLAGYDPSGADVLIPLGSIVLVRGSRPVRQVRALYGPVDVGLRLGSVLRRLARDRAGVEVLTRDGGRLYGTIDRVGVDFIELAVHPLDELRRPSAVRYVCLVVSKTILLVRRPPG